MADNTTLNTGTGGDVIATDDIAGVKFQRVKITLGADGVNNGDVSSSNAMPVNIVSNQADEFGFSTTTNLNNGATFDSGILALSPEFSQVQTHVRADQNGTINIYWYSDSGGTDQIRTLSISYSSSDGFQMFAAPAFSPYVKYTFTNTGATQTDFYFDTKFLTKAINGQILTLNGPLSTAMVANLGRNVIVGESTAGGGAFVNVKVNPSGTLETNATLAAGTNNIGDVDIASIAAGDNNIGNVDVVTLPSIPAGTNNIGDVDVLTLPSIPAGSNNIGDVDVLTLPSIPAGNNNIGDVDVASIAAGTNYIGKVRITDGTNDATLDSAYGDAESNTEVHLPVDSKGSIFNGTDWDRIRSANAVNANTTASETGIQAAGVGPGFSRIDSSQTITANAQSRTFNSKGTAQLGITISGTWTGTLVVEFTNDDSTWDQDEGGFNYATYRVATGSITSNVTLYFDSSATSQYRVRSTAWTSGTANIKFVGDINGAIQITNVVNPRPDRIGVDHVWKSANYTTQQTGAAMWTPAAGAKINLMHLAVSSYGTTAARVIIWYGASGDTTYTAGTDQLVWAGSFAPSTTAKPGMISNFTIPVRANTADYVLRITTDAAISLDIAMYGYETLTE